VSELLEKTESIISVATSIWDADEMKLLRKIIYKAFFSGRSDRIFTTQQKMYNTTQQILVFGINSLLVKINSI